jgi:hypothetical protein
LGVADDCKTYFSFVEARIFNAYDIARVDARLTGNTYVVRVILNLATCHKERCDEYGGNLFHLLALVRMGLSKASKEGFGCTFHPLPSLENQSTHCSIECQYLGVGMLKFGISLQDVEIGGCTARQTSQIVQALLQGELASKGCTVEVDDLKMTSTRGIDFVENIIDVEVVVQHTTIVHLAEEEHQVVEDILGLLVQQKIISYGTT